MTASNDLELSQTNWASEATHRRSKEQTAASQLDKHQVAGSTKAVQCGDKAADLDQDVRLAADDTRRGAEDSSRTSTRDTTTTRAESCSATTKAAQQKLDADAAGSDTSDTRGGEPNCHCKTQARIPSASGPPRQRQVSSDSRAATIPSGQPHYNQFLYEHQPHQQIMPISLQPFQVANAQHLLNYLEQQQQQLLLQPPAPQPGFYDQPLASWVCSPLDAGAMRDPHQLYAPALILQPHQPHQPVCTLPPNYNQHQLQPAVVPGNFGPASLVPIANYLPAPAFYTGHHQHLYSQSQHQPFQQVVAASQHQPSPPDKSSGLGGAHERAPESPSPSVSSSGSDSDAADTSRVIVDGDAAANANVCQKLAELANKFVPPQGANGKAAAERDERALALIDGTTTPSNRSTSQQRPAATMITMTKPTPGGNLIRHNDIGGSKNETSREQRRPAYEIESVNGAEADETRQEERKKAATPLGGEDQHAGARVKPFDDDAEAPSTHNQATTRLAADCETSTSLKESRCRVSSTPADIIDDQNRTKTIDKAQGANVLMVATNGETAPPQVKSIEETGREHSQLAGLRDNNTTSSSSYNTRHEPESVTRSKTIQLQDDAPPALPAQTGQISINGTTFYHINPALVRVGMPPLPLVQEQPVCVYQAANKDPVSYLAPGQPYHLANDYTQNQMLTLPPNRMAPDYYYFWPAAAAITTNSGRFDLVQTAGPNQQQQHLYRHPSYEFDQRPYLTLHHPLPFPKPFQYDPNHGTQQTPFVPQSPQVSHATNQNPIPAPPPAAAPVQGQTQALNLLPPATTSSAAPNQMSGSSSSGSGVSQLKLGYSLIPLLPINAIPTRVRQAYGMDKVWQDEFEQLFSQFVSQVVWTLVEVETNPNIRSSSRLLAYKGRYIVRVDNGSNPTAPAASDRSDGSCSVASTTNQDDKQAEIGPVCDDEDDTSSWAGAEDADTCCCPVVVSDGNSIDRSGEERQGRSVGSNSGESDCDSGAVLNSTSGSSETASQDLSELGPSQSPASSSPCHMAGSHQEASEGPTSNQQTNRDEPGCSKAQIGRKFPLKFRMFIDSAKVRFCCDSCGHGWTSMKGRVVFWYELFELIDGAGTTDGVSNLIGYCAYKLFGQQCDICKIENRFERPMWYPEEVTKVLCNFFNKIGQVYFGFRMPAIDKQRRAGKPKTSHNSLLCQACHDGVCTDRK